MREISTVNWFKLVKFDSVSALGWFVWVQKFDCPPDLNPTTLLWHYSCSIFMYMGKLESSYVERHAGGWRHLSMTEGKEINMNFLPVCMTMTACSSPQFDCNWSEITSFRWTWIWLVGPQKKSSYYQICRRTISSFGLNHQRESSIISRVTVGLTSQSVRWLWRAQRWGSPIPSVGSAWSNTGYRGPRAPSALWCWSSGGLESHCWGSWCSVAGGGAWPGIPNHLEDIFIHECMDFTSMMW